MNLKQAYQRNHQSQSFHFEQIRGANIEVRPRQKARGRGEDEAAKKL